MRITKTELYNFIDGKHSTELNKVTKEISAAKEKVKSMLEGILLPEYKDIASLANRLHEKYSEYIQKHGQYDNWTYRNHVGNLERIASTGKNLVGDTLTKIINHIEVGQYSEKSLLLSGDQLKEAKALLEPLFKKRQDLNVLHSELETVIKGSTSGKQAHKSLVALGVDMSGFETSEAKLPVVQKLSVDACLINGNC